jgi:hypothetical protein
MFEEGLKEAREEIGQAMAQIEMPQMKSIITMLESIQVKTEGASVTVTARIESEGGAAGILPLWFGMIGGVRVQRVR